MGKNKGGRPPIEIDIMQLEQCAEKQWTIEEIAAHFRVHRAVIDRRFAEEVKAAKARGLAKLVDLAWRRAIGGSDRMLEHLLNRFKGPIETKLKLDAKDLITIIEQTVAAGDESTH